MWIWDLLLGMLACELVEEWVDGCSVEVLARTERTYGVAYGYKPSIRLLELR